MERIVRNHSKTLTTNRHIKDLLPQILDQISAKVEVKPHRILSAWPEIVGERTAKMTQAVSFDRGILKVLVKNSTLYSLLVEHEKSRLLKELQKKFPTLNVRNILFKVG